MSKYDRQMAFGLLHSSIAWAICKSGNKELAVFSILCALCAFAHAILYAHHEYLDSKAGKK